MEIQTVKLNVDVRYSAVDPEDELVYVKKISPNGKPHFRVRIFLEGPDANNVQKVIYTLHPTFPKPRREITDSPRFELTIWTWGIFDLPVEIYDKQGRVDQRTIKFDYSADIQKAKANNNLKWTGLYR